MTMENERRCQLQGVSAMAVPVGRMNILRQMLKKIKRAAKRRRTYIRNLARAWGASGRGTAVAADPSTVPVRLRPGDAVRVRSKSEIQATLSNWNELNGCVMMEEMWAYCDTRQRVFKRVERFLDERDYLMKQTSGVVILDGVTCEGTVDFGSCDRSCFIFWREEWLDTTPEGPGEKPLQ